MKGAKISLAMSTSGSVRRGLAGFIVTFAEPEVGAMRRGLSVSEVALGTTLLVLSGDSDTTTAAVFGHTGSVIAVVVAMALLAATMVLALLAPRLPRALLVSGVAVFSLAIAAVGAMAIALLMTEPGVGFLLAFGWILTIPVALEVRRTSAPRNI
jgi:hypothetical protein